MRQQEFTAKQVARAIGVPYATLDRWVAARAVIPEVEAEGTGSRRRFTFRDLVLAELAHVLKERRMVLEEIAVIAEEVRRNWTSDDPADAGTVLVNFDGEPVAVWSMLDDPSSGNPPPKERDGWPMTDRYRPGESLFLIDVSAIGRRMAERVAKMDKERQK